MITIKPQAKRDLAEIAKYTQENWGRDQRIEYLSRFEKAFHKIEETPNLGQERNEIVQGLKSRYLGSHVIFYTQDSKYLTIIRILHQSRDIESAFG